MRRTRKIGAIRKILFLGVFGLVGVVGMAVDTSGQGLALKKAQKEIDPSIETYKKEIKEKCGDWEFEMKVDYNSFSAIPDRVFLSDSNGLLQVRNALRGVCTSPNDTSARDEDAAAAVRSKIKTIIITNIEDPKKKTITLKDGVLTDSSCFAISGGTVDYIAMKKMLIDIL